MREDKANKARGAPLDSAGRGAGTGAGLGPRTIARPLTGRGAPRPAPPVGRCGAPTRGARSCSAAAQAGLCDSQPRGAPVGLSQRRRARPLECSL